MDQRVSPFVKGREVLGLMESKMYYGETLQEVEHDLTPTPVLAFTVGALGGLILALMYNSARKERYGPATLHNVKQLEKNFAELKREAKMALQEAKIAKENASVI